MNKHGVTVIWNCWIAQIWKQIEKNRMNTGNQNWCELIFFSNY